MADIVEEKTSLLDSAIGPVAVTSTVFSKFNIDDYVQTCVMSKGEYLRILNKAATVDPLNAKNRPPVTLGGINLGGYDG